MTKLRIAAKAAGQKKMDIAYLEEHVPDLLYKVRCKLGFDNIGDVSDNLRTKEEVDEMISWMYPTEILEHYLEWEGIIGYTATLVRAVDTFRAAHK